MSTIERVRLLVEPLVADASVELYDVELSGGILRVLVDQPGGVAIERLTELTRTISRALDAADPIPGRFTLEVSSPGLERPLRTPAHFAGALGATVSVKTVAGTPGDRRLRGRLDEVDDDGFVLHLEPPPSDGPDTRRVSYAEVERAKTVFEWGPPPKPGGSKKKKKVNTP
jgi:ribosome maturation factor RimP